MQAADNDVAQPPASPLDVKAMVKARPGTQAPVPIQARANAGVDDFIVLKDVPDWLTFTGGARVAKGSWILYTNALDGAQMLVARTGVGRQDVGVEARAGGNEKLWRYTFVVEVVEPPPQSTVGAVASADPSPMDKSAGETKLAPKTEETLLQRAAQYIQTGNISGARLLFVYLADRGSVKAALRLARTYDPSYLKDLGVAGLEGNLDQAKRWYERAAELGNRDAKTRLTQLRKGVSR